MDSNVLFNVFIFLAATCLVVPLAGRFKLGSVLGYLIVGIAIGPFGAGLIHNNEQILQFSEFGVVMMLFLIGLALEPQTLWRLRKSILGLGSLQVVLTSVIFATLGVTLGYVWQVSLACGMALSLSSTALVLQVLEENGLLKTAAGESAFSVLLFQDIAVIPILIILPLLAVSHMHSHLTLHEGMLSRFPGWLHTLIVAAIISLIIIIGRYLSRYIFHFIVKVNLREIFTAVSLALIVGITLLMQIVDLSPALGAFLAGVVLANSEYKHSLESDIQPFKGLLLGLFFISIGMDMNFSLIAHHPIELFSFVLALVTIKGILLFILGRLRIFGLNSAQGMLFSMALAQGGEFAFVLFQFAERTGVLNSNQVAFLTLTVALSMAGTPLLIMINERLIVPRFMSRLSKKNYDVFNISGEPVIIAGYGRFGQIIGRFLQAQGVKTTILEEDADQIELLKRFGSKVYFGDASRMDMLQGAGADKARLLIIAIDDPDKALKIVRLARGQFPNLKIFARARNRRHAYELHKAGADLFRRETFDSALWLAQEAMKSLGYRAFDMRNKALQFRKHDENTLRKSFAFFEREPEMIAFSRRAAFELERILQADVRSEGGDNYHIEEWDG